MKAFRWCVIALMLAAAPLRAACTWPAWEKFKQDYISEGGRVIDPSDTRKITTSEGQSYALFFALAANDRKAFDKVLAWTRDNLAGGISTTRSPPGYGGKKTKTPGRLSIPIPPRMPISGSPGPCLKRGGYGKTLTIPVRARRYSSASPAKKW